MYSEIMWNYSNQQTKWLVHVSIGTEYTNALSDGSFIYTKSIWSQKLL